MDLFHLLYLDWGYIMNKLTMLDYVKETPGVLRTNIEQYTTLVDPLMKEVQQKEIKRILCLLLC